MNVLKLLVVTVFALKWFFFCQVSKPPNAIFEYISTKNQNELKKKNLKNFINHFSWIEFNCLKAAEPIWGDI